MNIEEWGKLRNFSVKENCRDGTPIVYEIEKIRAILMVHIDMYVSESKQLYHMKHDMKVVCRVHAIMHGDHYKKGEHPKGNAFDGSMVGMTLREAFFMALAFPFNGIGFYPMDEGVIDKKGNKKWGVKHPFLHLDMRVPRTANGQRSLWYRADGKYESDPVKVFERILLPDCSLVLTD